MSGEDKFSTDEAVREYLPLMHELAIRIDLVAHACEGRLNLTPPYAREYTYLQFRYMCELVALGCLQLHGDLPLSQKSKINKVWNAEKIMKLLHGDYQHSFPQSVIWDKTSNEHNIQCNSKPNALTREEFKKLYIECGDILHRGTIRTVKASFLKTDHDYQRILDWQSKIVELMNTHMVGRANGAGFYLISLKTTSNYPECSIFTPNKSGGFDVAIRNMDVKDHSDT